MTDVLVATAAEPEGDPPAAPPTITPAMAQAAMERDFAARRAACASIIDGALAKYGFVLTIRQTVVLEPRPG